MLLRVPRTAIRTTLQKQTYLQLPDESMEFASKLCMLVMQCLCLPEIHHKKFRYLFTIIYFEKRIQIFTSSVMQFMSGEKSLIPLMLHFILNSMNAGVKKKHRFAINVKNMLYLNTVLTKLSYRSFIPFHGQSNPWASSNCFCL